MSGYDSEPAKTADDTAKNRDAKNAKPALGGDPSAVGQALQHILTAQTAVAQLEKLARRIMNKAQDRAIADQAIAELAATLDEPAATANSELTTAWQMLSRTIGDEIDVQHRPVADAKAVALGHPSMKAAVEKITLDLAQVVSSIDGIGQARKDLRYDNKIGGMIGGLSHVRALVGLSEVGWDSLLKRVEIKVGVQAVALHGGLPLNQIEGWVNSIAFAWNDSANNFVEAVDTFVTSITIKALEKADSSVMDSLWDRAKELLLKGAALVSGTELAGTVGLAAISKLLAFQEAAESARAAQNEKAFVAAIKNQANTVKQAGSKDGAQTDVGHVVNKIAAQFEEIGRRNPDDAWKPGDNGVVGPQAAFLKNLEARADEYRHSVPSINDFTASLNTSWVNANHQVRERSALRSPLADSHYQDGYIELKSTLHATASGWFLVTGPGILHCPKADTVAEELMRTITPFSVANAGIDVIMDLTIDDLSRDQLPKFWDPSEEHQVRFNTIQQVTSGSTKPYWDWVQRNARTSTYEELARVTELKGA